MRPYAVAVARPSEVDGFDMPEAVYLPDGPGRFESTPLAAGPWDPAAQHAGAPAALLASCMERHDRGDAVFGLLARVTVDLIRPIPVAPLEVDVRTVRAGRRVTWLEAEMNSGGKAVARASAVRLADTPIALRDAVELGHTAPPAPETLSTPQRDEPPPWLMFGAAFDFRPVRSSWQTEGPASQWFKFDHPLVADVENTPVVAVMAAADFTLGLGRALDYQTYAAPNADLTVHLFREPVSSWVFLDAGVRLGESGNGLAQAGLSDEAGPVGMALQTQIISIREPPPGS